MALVTATIPDVGNVYRWTGGSGVNSGDIVIQTGDVSRFDEFMVGSAVGDCQVIVSVDGINYVAAPLSLIDLGANSSIPVLGTTAARVYAFYGMYAFIQVQQAGSGAVSGAYLVASKKGGQF